MKKFFILVAFVLPLLCNIDVCAQTKQELKAVKSQARSLEKEGWQVENGMTSLQNELARIEAKRGDAEILVGSSYGKKKMSLAKKESRNDAINEYAEYAKSIVKGRIVSGFSDISEEETDNVMGGFERLVVRELNGEINVPALVLIRTNGTSNDCRCYYVIDAKAAEKARERALKTALDEANVATELGTKISDFISDGFNKKK